MTLHHPSCPARQMPGYPECTCPPATARVPRLPSPSPVRRRAARPRVLALRAVRRPQSPS